jgi:hypothetical protein
MDNLKLSLSPDAQPLSSFREDGKGLERQTFTANYCVQFLLSSTQFSMDYKMCDYGEEGTNDHHRTRFTWVENKFQGDASGQGSEGKFKSFLRGQSVIYVFRFSASHHESVVDGKTICILDVTSSRWQEI